MARRPITNATPSGTAVSASAALWMVLPSSATDPDSATITACTAAVAPSVASEIHNVRMPSREVSIAASTLSPASWLCGTSTCPTR
ncbi:MAG TPA: hypothetical protein VNO54_17575 [Streptosporangiaceae bacterium]|nr:hypothetical protein [Streptosporangiaceae bacterium]